MLLNKKGLNSKMIKIQKLVKYKMKLEISID